VLKEYRARQVFKVPLDFKDDKGSKVPRVHKDIKVL
jgi:hypothetical protein